MSRPQFFDAPNKVESLPICFHSRQTLPVKHRTKFGTNRQTAIVKSKFPTVNLEGAKLKSWQNDETCCQKHLLPTHVSPMFPRFATRETLFSTTKYVSASGQKHNLLLETVFPVWQTWETSGETCVRGKCFWQHLSSFCKGLKG